MKKYVCISEEEIGLLDLFNEHKKKIDYLILAGKKSSSNLLTGESYNDRRLAESIERIKRDFCVTNMGFPSFVENIEGVMQRNYQFNSDILETLATYEKIKETNREGIGIEILGLNSNFISSILRAYGLPFPANIRNIKQ